MARFSFPDMTFAALPDGGIRCTLFARYDFALSKAELERLGSFAVHADALAFPDASEKRVRNKLGLLVEEGIRRRLVHRLYKKPAFYLTEESGVPLLGSTEIGVVDRGSNIIEIKPLTGCNFTCTYCSVDEGKNRKSHDYLVEEEYLVRVAADVAARKEHPVEFNIGPHGEPLLYPKLVELVRDLKRIPNTAIISMNTNGSLLSEKLIDDLAAAGLTRVNLSIPALDEELASELAGVPKFPMAHLLAMLAYGKEKINFLLAPVLIPGKNEKEMAKIVELSKTIASPYPAIGIQNYLEYPKGRRPVKKQLAWDEFFGFIEGLERETGTSLTSTKEDFRIHEEKELEKPFRKGQTVACEVCMPGRYPNEMYAQAGGRLIGVRLDNDLANIGKRLRVKIVRDKHSIYKGVPVGKR